MTDDKKPVLGDTPRPTKEPRIERWLDDWATRSPNVPPSESYPAEGELDLPMEPPTDDEDAA